MSKITRRNHKGVKLVSVECTLCYRKIKAKTYKDRKCKWLRIPFILPKQYKYKHNIDICPICQRTLRRVL